MRIRRAVSEDISAVAGIYEKILDREQRGLIRTGWLPGVYPVRETALAALERGDLFVCEEAGEVLASAIINQRQVDVYSQGRWKCEAEDGEVMVLHTLVVDPEVSGRGVGRSFVNYYEEYARACGCRELRMDTNEKNTAARRLYKKLGYQEIGIVPCTFNGIPDVGLVLLEKTAPF